MDCDSPTTTSYKLLKQQQQRKKSHYWQSLDKYTDYAFTKNRSRDESDFFSRSNSLQTSRKRQQQQQQFNSIKGFPLFIGKFKNMIGFLM